VIVAVSPKAIGIFSSSFSSVKPLASFFFLLACSSDLYTFLHDDLLFENPLLVALKNLQRFPIGLMSWIPA